MQIKGEINVSNSKDLIVSSNLSST